MHRLKRLANTILKLLGWLHMMSTIRTIHTLVLFCDFLVSQWFVWWLVCTVMATDIDSVTNSQLTYSVSDGNFTVQTVNNVGYIRTAQSVDFLPVYSHSLLTTFQQSPTYWRHFTFVK